MEQIEVNHDDKYEEIIYLDLDIVKEEYVVNEDVLEEKLEDVKVKKEESPEVIEYIINEYDDETITKYISKSSNGSLCKECHKVFKNEYTLKLHMKRVHNIADGNINLVCFTCKKSFMSVWHLKRHARQAHYKCLYCDTVFCHAVALETHCSIRHLMFPNDIDDFPYTCTCGVIVNDLEALVQHIDQKIRNRYSLNGN